MLNIPNILTLVRILVIPFFVLAFYLPTSWGGHVIAAVIFASACITDWLDGYLARSLKLSTRFGAFLDPVADKMMVSIALVMIVAERQFQYLSTTNAVILIPSYIVTIPAAIIVSREIIVSSLRDWENQKRRRFQNGKNQNQRADARVDSANLLRSEHTSIHYGTRVNLTLCRRHFDRLVHDDLFKGGLA
jgi:CDP-diacylglycerol--glycerol-3-phosphate 3-phosphatidyltransferase